MECAMELTTKIINSVLALGAAAALGAGGMYLYHRDDIKGASDYKLISECEAILSENGMTYPDTETKEESALRGFLAAYNDKYTGYLRSDEEGSYVAWVNSNTCMVSTGYTVEISENGALTVGSVKKGSPADKQGIMAGDTILGVDSFTVNDDGIQKVAYELLGKDGTVMTLRISRDSAEKELSITRSLNEDDEVANITLTSHGDILCIRIKSIENISSGNLVALLDDYDKKFGKVIVDLRDNAGGYTAESVKIADMFIGEAAVTMHYNKGDTETFDTADSPDDMKLPIVVLVNEKTASAAEIMTALLKQYGAETTIVGENTFGKGIFQEQEKLSNGGFLQYTAGYYTVGDWECYQGKGIAPDVEVEMDSSLIGTDDDVQMKKALDILS